MDRELRTTLVIMVITLVVGAPMIFAAPGPASTNYLALVMYIAPPPTPPNALPTAPPTATSRPTRTPLPTKTPTNTPVIGVTITPTFGPSPTRTPIAGCAAEYPDFCIPPPPPDLNCPDIGVHNFTVLPPDRHHFDMDHDGIGCEQN